MVTFQLHLMHAKYKKSLDFVITRFIMKLFKTCNSVIIYECMDFFGSQLPSILLSKGSTNFELNIESVGFNR